MDVPVFAKKSDYVVIRTEGGMFALNKNELPTSEKPYVLVKATELYAVKLVQNERGMGVGVAPFNKIMPLGVTEVQIPESQISEIWILESGSPVEQAIVRERSGLVTPGSN